MYTPTSFSYDEHKLFVQQNFITFRVKACMDAYIAISPVDEDDDWYLVFILCCGRKFKTICE